MEATYNYILQSGACLLLLYLFYMLALRSFPRAAFNRLYLLLAPIAAFIIPLLNLPLPVATQYSLVPIIPTIELSGVVVTAYVPQANDAAANLVRVEFILAIVYVLAALALLARLGLQLLKLRKLTTTATPAKDIETSATVLHTSNYATFAFMSYIFLNHQPHLSKEEQQQVLAHELAHVRLGHSYDVLYYEVLSAILWFNPLVWLLKAELRDVHEFQADAAVVSEHQPDVYTSLLAKEALSRTGIPVGHHFHKPQVFKRLHMLQKRNQQTTILRPLLAVPLLLLLVFFFSAKDVTADMVEQLTAPVAKKAGNQIPAQPDIKPVTATITEPVKEIPGAVEPAKETKKEPEKTTLKPKEEFKAPAPEEPYVYVEQMPSYAGGELEMQKFIARSIRYPKTTQEAGIAGLVVASFIVQPDGTLSDVIILKGLDEAADQEAIRVVEAMNGKWEPGRQNGNVVPVRFTLPIRFALVN